MVGSARRTRAVRLAAWPALRQARHEKAAKPRRAKRTHARRKRAGAVEGASRDARADRPVRPPATVLGSAKASGRDRSIGHATSRSHRPAAYRAKVRMYRQGLGDCFLISLKRSRATRLTYKILIDCGVILGTPDPATIMTKVVDDIVATTGGKVDLLLATHEHWDHFSGFIQAATSFRRAYGRRGVAGVDRGPGRPARSAITQRTQESDCGVADSRQHFAHDRPIGRFGLTRTQTRTSSRTCWASSAPPAAAYDQRRTRQGQGDGDGALLPAEGCRRSSSAIRTRGSMCLDRRRTPS